MQLPKIAGRGWAFPNRNANVCNDGAGVKGPIDFLCQVDNKKYVDVYNAHTHPGPLLCTLKTETITYSHSGLHHNFQILPPFKLPYSLLHSVPQESDLLYLFFSHTVFSVFIFKTVLLYFICFCHYYC